MQTFVSVSCANASNLTERTTAPAARGKCYWKRCQTSGQRMLTKDLIAGVGRIFRRGTISCEIDHSATAVLLLCHHWGFTQQQRLSML